MWARSRCSRSAAHAFGVGSGGFEPPKLTHLIYSQAQLSTLATARVPVPREARAGADDGTRTRNLLFTKQLLCQLSYVGKPDATKSCANGEYTNGFGERQREIAGFLRGMVTSSPSDVSTPISIQLNNYSCIISAEIAHGTTTQTGSICCDSRERLRRTRRSYRRGPGGSLRTANRGTISRNSPRSSA